MIWKFENTCKIKQLKNVSADIVFCQSEDMVWQTLTVQCSLYRQRQYLFTNWNQRREIGDVSVCKKYESIQNCTPFIAEKLPSSTIFYFSASGCVHGFKMQFHIEMVNLLKFILLLKLPAMKQFQIVQYENFDLYDMNSIQ